MRGYMSSNTFPCIISWTFNKGTACTVIVQPIMEIMTCSQKIANTIARIRLFLFIYLDAKTDKVLSKCEHFNPIWYYTQN